MASGVVLPTFGVHVFFFFSFHFLCHVFSSFFFSNVSSFLHVSIFPFVHFSIFSFFHLPFCRPRTFHWLRTQK